MHKMRCLLINRITLLLPFRPLRKTPIFFFQRIRPPPKSTLFPYPTLFRSYALDCLADDAAAVIEQLGIAPCHLVGLSMGGMIGMRLAARRPELVRSLVLLETSAEPEPQIGRAHV